MKKSLIFIICFAVATNCFAQNKKVLNEKPKINKLTATDRKNFKLSIDQRIVSKLKYTLPRNYNDDRNVLLVPALFENHSNDTLKYLSMSCSWDEFYVIDDGSAAKIARRPCDSNFPIMQKIPPHKHVNIQLAVVKINGGKKIKIGVILIKMDNNNPFYFMDIEKTLPLLTKRSNIIWSNEIELP